MNIDEQLEERRVAAAASLWQATSLKMRGVL